MKAILIALFFITYTFTATRAPAEEYSPEMQARIQTIQQDMRSDLREGRTEHARNTLEKAAGNFHAVEIELGLIQTLMQAGEYRHALSAAAHAQGEHSELADTNLFYAWLLALGGQMNPAIQLLETAPAQQKNTESVILMLKQIKANKLASAELKTSDAIQLKPFTSEKSGIKNLQKYLTSGVIIDNGKKIITTLSEVENSKTLSVRDGLGRTAIAQLEYKTPDAHLAILKLEAPIHSQSEIIISNKPPFPGKPIYIIGFPQTNNNQADWPQLQIDILGIPSEIKPHEYPIHVRTAHNGSGVYDQLGILIGILADDDKKIMLPLIDKTLATYFKSSEQSLEKLSVDKIYEAALSNTVQIFDTSSSY